MTLDFPSLQTICLGEKVFEDVITLKISNLISIQTIYGGSGCFKNVRSFILTGMTE